MDIAATLASLHKRLDRVEAKRAARGSITDGEGNELLAASESGVGLQKPGQWRGADYVAFGVSYTKYLSGTVNSDHGYVNTTQWFPHCEQWIGNFSKDFFCYYTSMNAWLCEVSADLYQGSTIVAQMYPITLVPNADGLGVLPMRFANTGLAPRVWGANSVLVVRSRFISAQAPGTVFRFAALGYSTL